MSDRCPGALDRLPKSFSAGLSGEVWSSLTSGVRLTAARADVRGAEGHIATGVLFSESRQGRRPRSVTMGKGKKRPWIQAKIAAAQEGGGGKEAAVLAEAERRKKQKAADRAARERAFKEQNPERFVKDGEDDEGGFGGGETNAGDGGGDENATADGWSARDGNAGNAASRGGTTVSYTHLTLPTTPYV